MRVQFQWKPYNTTNSQEVQYKLSKSNVWSSYGIVTATTTSVYIDNIIPNVLYDFRILNLCKNETTSSDVQTKAFLNCLNIIAKSTNSSVELSTTIDGDVDKYIFTLYNSKDEIIETSVKTGPFAPQEQITINFEELSTKTLYKYTLKTYISKINHSKEDCDKQIIYTL